MKVWKRLLIANRGEVAIRVARAAAELGIGTVAIFSEEDRNSLHTRKADEARALQGSGVAAYLDIEQILAIARDTGCEAIHPGYGFLSENPGFARRCAETGIVFVGPRVETLELFGDKVHARKLAVDCNVPVAPGPPGPASLEEAHEFLRSLGPGESIMLKAVAGGGGRGMRTVHPGEDLREAYARCRSEARTAFGRDDVYVERLIQQARHIEVQIVADRSGAITHLGERECTLQRRHQKLVEVAPSPSLSERLRKRIIEAARRMAEVVRYDNLGTFEFLVDVAEPRDGEGFSFIEANPRLQVEHTVSEEIFRIDLVKTQILLAAGTSLRELGLMQSDIERPRGYAIQLRINMERMGESTAIPTTGTLKAFDPPSGPGIRVDTHGYMGYRTTVAFDSLLAKLIAHSPSPRYSDVLAKAYRALCEFKIDGVATNIPFLQALLRHPAVAENSITTRFVEEHGSALLANDKGVHQQLFFANEMNDTLPATNGPEALVGPPGAIAVGAPMQATVLAIEVGDGDLVRPGQQIAVLEAMKMEHIVRADVGGVVRQVAAAKGDTVASGQAIVFLEPAEGETVTNEAEESWNLDEIRPDLAEVRHRHAVGLDENRPDAVARRRKTHQRTARENVSDLCDPGSFVEYGPLAIAARRRRQPVEELVRETPADGLIAGVATVNGGLFEAEKAKCTVVAYDYTVLAGTQGQMNHKKQDRIFSLAEKWRLPVVLFAEGGGGRPGDTDRLGLTGLDIPTFGQFARLSGLVPLVGVVSGRCFAGNAALLGCCDAIIATRNATIGMGGPAMIEGGGLGVYAPEEVGPVSFQAPNGVIDVLVADESEAVRTAKQYLSYFQGSLKEWACADQRKLRRAVPANRLRAYDVRPVIESLADTGSILELRRQFGVGIITAFIRIEGHPLGLLANNPTHLGGAIDSPAADKAARFVQLCDAFDIPILSLCDTPGFMVGPEAEKTALVRHVCRMFVTSASISVPYFTVVLRKGYGLGAQAMAGGGFHNSFFTISWPTGEFGGMGLEGAVKLGYRKELASIFDPVERQRRFDEMVATYYENGKALSVASVLEIDDVIDPAETRRWIMSGLRSGSKPKRSASRKRPFVDAW